VLAEDGGNLQAGAHGGGLEKAAWAPAARSPRAAGRWPHPPRSSILQTATTDPASWLPLSCCP
jgi:hypothetical protein